MNILLGLQYSGR